MTAPVRLLRQLSTAIGVLVAFALPVLDAPPEIGLVTVLLAVAIAGAVLVVAMHVVGRAPLRPARHVVTRVLPRPSQSDPDARGHARPRAPGRLLPAV